METNPYESPKSDLRQDSGAAPALWNPDVAGVWSLFLTPVFGSAPLLQNWKSLGDGARAKTGRTWLILSIVMIIPTLLIPLVGLIYIIIWYFAWQRFQTRYVKQRWGKEYPRKSWAKPLLIGIPVVLAIP
jgi:hypothetical protein